MLKLFQDRGYKTQLYDVRWLAKIFNGEYFIDIIWDTVNNICRVDDSWYENASTGAFAGRQVKFLPAEELLFCKLYVQNRERFDGADVNHVMLRHGKNIDWKRLLLRMDPHWHILLSALLMFQFCYPSDYREIIPQWPFNELMERVHAHYEMPSPWNSIPQC